MGNHIGILTAHQRRRALRKRDLEKGESMHIMMLEILGESHRRGGGGVHAADGSAMVGLRWWSCMGIPAPWPFASIYKREPSMLVVAGGRTIVQ